MSSFIYDLTLSNLLFAMATKSADLAHFKSMPSSS